MDSALEPPLVLDGAPLTSDSSIRDFDNGRVGYVANSLEQALLLPQDMAELRNIKKHEMFLSLKRDLALVCTPHIFLYVGIPPLISAWRLDH